MLQYLGRAGLVDPVKPTITQVIINKQGKLELELVELELELVELKLELVELELLGLELVELGLELVELEIS